MVVVAALAGSNLTSPGRSGVGGGPTTASGGCFISLSFLFFSFLFFSFSVDKSTYDDHHARSTMVQYYTRARGRELLAANARWVVQQQQQQQRRRQRQQQRRQDDEKKQKKEDRGPSGARSESFTGAAASTATPRLRSKRRGSVAALQ